MENEGEQDRERWWLWAAIGTAVMAADVVTLASLFFFHPPCDVGGPHAGFAVLGQLFFSVIATMFGFVVLGAQWSISMNVEADGRGPVGDVLRTLVMVAVLAFAIGVKVWMVSLGC